MPEQVAQMDMKMFSCFSHQQGVAFNMTQPFTVLKITRAERVEALLSYRSILGLSLCQNTASCLPALRQHDSKIIKSKCENAKKTY